jgi:WD domain, G-beta repeat
MNQVLTEPRSAPATELTGNPYVGFRPFTREDDKLFFGREHETRELVSLLNAERLVLLYSPSGAGKTSLIQARLIPALERQRFEVLPIIRMNRVPSITDSTCAHPSNRYVDSVLSCLGLTVPGGKEAGLVSADDTRVDRAEPSLSEYLDLRTRPPGRKAEFLIFDQFEEVFTLDPTDVAAKHEFFKQLGAALRGREDRDSSPDAGAPPRSPRWALFAIREEYLGALEPYLPFLPSRLTTSLHLRYLDERRALAAIREPARLAGVEIDEEAARWLFVSLAKRWALPPGGREPQLVEGSCVEAMQLQIVCRRLWDHLPPGQQRITQEDLQRPDAGLGLDQVDAALNDYYQEAVKQVASECSTVKERALRKWIDRQLITRQGLRGQVLLEPGQTQDLPNAAIDALEATGLIRREERNGGFWVELAHDRLIRPIRKNNDAWYKSHLSLLQISAQAWEQANGESAKSALLLRGRALEEAKRWGEKHPDELSDIDRKFLAQATGERRRQRTQDLWLAGMLATLLIVVALIVISVWQNRLYALEHKLKEQIEANYWAARAQVEWKSDPDAALFLALRAWERHPADGGEHAAAGHVLADLLSQTAGHALMGHDGPIRQVQQAGDWLVSASQDKTVRLWPRRGSPDSHPTVLRGHTKTITYFDVNQDETLLATASVDKTVRVWDLKDPANF